MRQAPADLVIRREQPADEAAVRELLTAAFSGADEAALVDGLRPNPQAFTLVAEVHGTIAGAITFSPVTSRPPAAGLRAVGLAPMAVAPAWQRRGIGGALIAAGLAECRAHRIGLVVVLGHPGYYPRFGFRSARPLELRCRWSRDDDSFMYLELEPGQAALAGTHVDYALEFDRFG